MTGARGENKFRGTFPQKIDAKGRVSFPAKFRTVAELDDPDFRPYLNKEDPGVFATITLVFGEPGMKYFEGYSVEGMRRIDKLIESKPIGSSDRPRLEEIYYSNSHELQIDIDGRIIIPQFMRERLALNGDVVFVAKGDHFQLWNPVTRDRIAGPREKVRAAEYDAGFDPRTLFAAADTTTGGGQP